MARKAFVFALILTLAPTLAFAKDETHHKKRVHHAEPVVKLHGHASYYADHFQGKKTATGETFSQDKLTAASKTLPLGSKAVVRNPETGKSVEVTVNDRGPYVGGRIIDLSKKAASQIGIDKKDGVAPVEVEVRPSAQPTPDLKDAVTQVAKDQASKEQVAQAQGQASAPTPAQGQAQGR